MGRKSPHERQPVVVPLLAAKKPSFLSKTGRSEHENALSAPFSVFRGLLVAPCEVAVFVRLSGDSSLGLSEAHTATLVTLLSHAHVVEDEERGQ